MTKVMIVADNPGSSETMFRASADNRQAVGRTVGTALDGLTAQLDDSAGTIVVVQNLKPDQFFAGDQQHRLQFLFEKWRIARDHGAVLEQSEQAELEALVTTEIDGATDRAHAIAKELGR